MPYWLEALLDIVSCFLGMFLAAGMIIGIESYKDNKRMKRRTEDIEWRKSFLRKLDDFREDRCSKNLPLDFYVFRDIIQDELNNVEEIAKENMKHEKRKKD